MAAADWEWMKGVNGISKQELNRRCWGYEPGYGVIATDGVVLCLRKMDVILLEDLPYFRYGPPNKGPLSLPVRQVGLVKMAAFKAALAPKVCPQCKGAGTIDCTKCKATGFQFCITCGRDGAGCLRCHKTKREPCPACVDPNGAQRRDYRFRFGVPIKIDRVVINGNVLWEPLLELPGVFNVGVGLHFVRLDSPDWAIVVAGVHPEENGNYNELEMTAYVKDGCEQ